MIVLCPLRLMSGQQQSHMNHIVAIVLDSQGGLWSDKEIGAVLALQDVHNEVHDQAPMGVNNKLAERLGIYLGKLMGNQGRSTCAVRNFLQSLPEKMRDGKITKKHREISGQLQADTAQKEQLVAILDDCGAAFGRKKGLKVSQGSQILCCTVPAKSRQGSDVERVDCCHFLTTIETSGNTYTSIFHFH